MGRKRSASKEVEEEVDTAAEAPIVKHPPRKLPVAVVREQMAFINELDVRGIPQAQIVRAFLQRWHTTRQWPYRLIQRVRAEQEEAGKQERTGLRHRQTRLMMNMLQHAVGEKRIVPDAEGRPSEVWVRPPDHQAVIGYQREIARINGTYAPEEIRIQIDVRETLLQVVGRMDEKRMDEYLQAARERQKLAREGAKALGLPEPKTLEATSFEEKAG